MTDKVYDVVIVGAGHNGLTCAAYLARAGLSVKVVERRGVVGGAAVTEEFHPGFRNSVCSYTVGLLNPKIVNELNLYDYGLEIIPRPLSLFVPLQNGGHIKLHPKQEKTRAEIARFSEKDADNLADYEAAIGRLADVVRSLLLETPPNVGGGLGELWKLWKTGRRFQGMGLEEQRELADIMVMSAADYLDRWFEHDATKALFAFDGIVGTLASPYTPGTAYVLLHHCFGDIMAGEGGWGHAVGGMGAISQAMARVAEDAGAEIEVSAPVAEITVSNRRTEGVRLEDGRLIRGRAVAANVGPKLLFLGLMDEAHLDPPFRRRMENYRCRSASFRMNVALRELPDFICLPGTHQQEHHTGGIMVCGEVAYLDAAYRDALDFGWSRRPIVEVLIPSTIDKTLAPEGQHVASLFCQHFDPELPDGRSWDDAKDEAVESIINTVNEFAPNFRDSIIARQALSPLDLEREFGLTGGDIFHGALDVNQLFSARPTLGYADYRMPVKGLYLCGSGAHPGGGVTGVPGHNAAREIIRDL